MPSFLLFSSKKGKVDINVFESEKLRVENVDANTASNCSTKEKLYSDSSCATGAPSGGAQIDKVHVSKHKRNKFMTPTTKH